MNRKMITVQYLKTMALYNKWQNENLFTICDNLEHNQIHLERGMFFNSIFKTLNHIIHVDQIIYAFIYTKALPKFDVNFIPYSEYL